MLSEEIQQIKARHRRERAELAERHAAELNAARSAYHDSVRSRLTDTIAYLPAPGGRRSSITRIELVSLAVRYRTPMPSLEQICREHSVDIVE